MKILKVYESAFKSKHRYLVLRGGAGSGKSYFATQKLVTRLLTETGHKILVVRKVAATLKNSVFSLFQQIISSENLVEYFQINKSDFTIICTLNNNQVIFCGLDDVEKIKSIAGITTMFIEEATELSLGDWEQLQLRIRGKYNNYVQYILCFNPISEQHWLKTAFWDIDDEDVYKLVTTYKNNNFLSEADIKHFEQRVKKNHQIWRVYGLGEWGSIQTGGEMVDKFNYSYNVCDCIYNPNLPLHISLDFNVLPHCSMGIFQVENKIIKCIDEVAEEHPRNRTKDMCIELLSRYSSHVGGLFVYGDRNGQNEGTRNEAGVNDYSIVMTELKQLKPQLRLNTVNPSVAMSTNFLNSILEHDVGELKLFIDTKCKKIINDMLYLKQNSEGGKLIEYEKHPVTKTKYEKYGHFFDLTRYFLTTCFAREYQFYQVGTKPFSNVTLGGQLHNNGNTHRISKHSY